MGRVFVCTCLMAATAATLMAAPSPPASGVLERRVPAFSVGDESRIQALIRFARKNRIPLGIEAPNSELDDQISVSIPATNVREAIRTILANSPNYVIARFQGIVSIRSAATPPPVWLDTTIPRFTIPRTTIATASASLWMALERQLNSTQQGFAGTFPTGDPTDLVGPLDIRGATVRVLLAQLVRESPQSCWIVTRPGTKVGPPAAVNRFWTTISRGGSP